MAAQFGRHGDFILISLSGKYTMIVCIGKKNKSKHVGIC